MIIILLNSRIVENVFKIKCDFDFKIYLKLKFI